MDNKSERLRSIAVLCAYTGRCVADLAEEEIDIMRNALDVVFRAQIAALTTPTPPAQDGERFTCPYCVPRCECGYEREIAGATAVQRRIDADAAELAALRAQVEGLRTALCSVMQEVQRELRGQVAKTIFDLCDAALAPQQPVAKETKP